MNSSKMKFAGKAAGAVAIAVALMASVAGLAGASPSHHDRFGRYGVSSGRKSIFGYARIGEGGYVTAVVGATATSDASMTVDRWDGQTTTYTITGTTTFTEGGLPTTESSLVVGDRVNIRLARSAPTTALKVNIELAELSGKVTSVDDSTNTITITGGQGFSRTIVVGPATKYFESGTTVGLGAVTTGEQIFAEGTIDPNLTSLDALTVIIGRTLLYHGYVTAVADSTATTNGSVTVNRLDGKTTTFTITPATTFTQGSTPLTASDLVVGDRVGVFVNTTAVTDALRINIELARIAGRVSNINGDTLTVTGGQGFSRTVLVGDSTTYTQGGAPATFADVLVGSYIVARGTIDPNLTTLDATTVAIAAVGHPETFVGSVAAVTITATTSSVTVNRLDGQTTTFAITPTTVVTEGSAALTPASLTVGDRVSVVANSLAPTTALKINIELATLGGRVTAAVGDLITITTVQGFSREILVNDNTTYTEGGASVMLNSVTVGSKIVAQGTVDPNLTTLDASSVKIITAVVTGHAETFHGLVTAVADATATTNGSVTLNRLDGQTTTYVITPTTTFTEGSASMTAADLVVGDSAGINVNSSAPTTALSVNIVLATMTGHVTSVVGDVITITGGEGFSRTILVNDNTTYTEGGASVMLNSVTVGSKIVAQGQVDADLTTLDATSVTIS
jgi:hypothetical protein